MNPPPHKLSDLSLLIVDCQTTGATPEKSHLLEIAWQACGPDDEHKQPIEKRLLRLGEASLPRRIAKITGITQEEIDQVGVEPIDAQRDFVDALRQVNIGDAANRLCVAHYARFERRFTDALLAADGNDILPYFICSYELARRLLPQLPKHTIRALAGYFGFSLGQLRRAADHVAATATIWNGLLGLLKEKGITTLEETQRLLAEPARRTSQVEFPIEKQKLSELPRGSGIYRFLDSNGRVLYVGKATDLRSRVRSYFRPKGYQASTTREMLTQVVDLQTRPTDSPLEAALLEIGEIQRRSPPYNSSLKVLSSNLYCLSRETSEITTSAAEVGAIGPFPSERGPLALRVLARLWTDPHTVDDPLEEILWVLGADDSLQDHLDLVASAVNNLQAILGSRRASSDVYDTLLAQSAAIWPWYAAREKTPEDDSEEEIQEPADEWSIARVARRFIGALVHAGRLQRRGCWLKLMERLELHYVFEDRTLSFAPARDPLWTGLTNRGGYDRAVVLTTEIRTLLRRGTFRSLDGACGIHLGPERTENLLGWF